MSLLFFTIETAFLHVFLHAISFFYNPLLITSAVQKQDFVRIKCIGVPPKEEKCRFFFLESNGIFPCIFTCHFIFSKFFSIFLLLQKQHFASLERIGVPQKEEKCHFSFSLMKRHFCMNFSCHFIFLKSFLILLRLQKQHFASQECIGVPPKEEKFQFLFLQSNGTFACIFTMHLIFFKVSFNFTLVTEAAFCKSRVRRGTPKGGKMSLLFFSNETAFFHAFLPAISFFPIPFRFCLPSKSSILQV